MQSENGNGTFNSTMGTLYYLMEEGWRGVEKPLRQSSSARQKDHLCLRRSLGENVCNNEAVDYAEDTRRESETNIFGMM